MDKVEMPIRKEPCYCRAEYVCQLTDKEKETCPTLKLLQEERKNKIREIKIFDLFRNFTV